MKFTKIGKALLTGALSAGVIFSLSACKQDYTVGYLYVTETATAGTSGSGHVTGFAIDHNTGNLNKIAGLPIGSGGSNPSRAVLMPGGRFLFVLNRGSNTSAPSGEECTTAYPCTNGNITVFSVGGNGSLAQQYIIDLGPNGQNLGLNPFRMLIDSSGTYLYVLLHDAYGADGSTPATASNVNSLCESMISADDGACGAIAAFSIDSSSGFLSPVKNAQATANTGSTVKYFPVPANPVDFAIAGGYLFTIADSTTTEYFPYSYSAASAGATTYFAYAISSSSSNTSGLLYTYTYSGPNSLGADGGVAIAYANGYVYVLDNEASTTSEILPFTVSSVGSLSSQTGGAVSEDTSVSNPIALLVESGAKWAYIANYGNGTDENNALSRIQGYTIDSSTKRLTTLSGSPWGTGSGPVCLVEDPSNQYIYAANYVSANVTGRIINQITGGLDSATGSATLDGPATWCLVDGRTN